jgi:hypothetical protein
MGTAGGLMKLWATVASGILVYASTFCLAMALGAGNEKGMVIYGVSTIFTGVLFKVMLSIV